MANYGANENVIEWLRGQKRATVSLSNPEMIRAVFEMAKKDKAIEIVEKGKFTMCATIPLDYLDIRKPRKKRG